MKNLLLLLIVALSNTTVLFSQNFSWANRVGSTNFDEGLSIVVDNSGNTYSTGFFQGTVDFDPGSGVFNLTSAGFEDIYISKNDAQGNLIWAKRMGGVFADKGYSVIIDNAGNVYTTGVFAGTADFDPGIDVFNFTSTGTNDSDIFISKLDAFGNFVWAKRIGNSSGADIGNSLGYDPSGYIYITGCFTGIMDFDPGPETFVLNPGNGSLDVFILKLDMAGNFVWAKMMGSTQGSDIGYSVTLDTQGNVYTTGSFANSVDFDPGVGVFNLVSAGFDIFISKLDASGNFIWAKTFGSAGTDIAYTANVDSFDNVYITGYFTNTIDFDPGPNIFNLTSAGSTDIFVIKLNPSGNFIWSKQIGGTSNDIALSSCLDTSGNIHLTGYFASTADFDPGPNVLNLTSVGNKDIFVVKLDYSGNFLWAKKMGGSQIDEGASIAVDLIGNIYTTGNFRTTADFDPGTSVFNLISANSASDIFVNKLYNCFSSSSLITIESCDSYISPSGNFTWTSSGIYLDTLLNVLGCDSLITVNLTIYDSPTPITTASSSIICQGQSTLLSTNIVAGSTYQWQKNGVNISGATTANYSATSAGSYSVIVTSSGGCSTASNAVALTLLNNTTPTFTQLSSCVGGQIILPTVSIENISGSWSPAVNNAVTTTYTFTPNAGQCASSQTMTVPVNSIVEPTFTQLSAICTGGTIDLPTISNENIAGLWSPSADNQATTTYYFIPNPGQCASYSTTMTVTVNTPITPTFPQISAICAGGTIALPVVSNQNIAGSWSPNVNNQSTTTYSFTPNAGQCANSQTMTVIVNSYPTINTQPTSTQVNIGNQAIFTTSANGGTYQWQVNSGSGFQNITNGGQYIGATTNTLTVSNTSMSNNTNQYQCIVTSNNCSATSNVATLTVINNVGLSEVDSWNNIEIYPNPTSNSVTVSFNNNLVGSGYEIIDNSGRTVVKGTLLDENQTVDLNNLSAGIYSFRLTGELPKTIKLVKN